MENEHELSYETFKRVYLRSYEHYKSVGAGVELLEPGFELDNQEWVEMGSFLFDLIKQRFAAMVGYIKKMGGASLNERCEWEIYREEVKGNLVALGNKLDSEVDALRKRQELEYKRFEEVKNMLKSLTNKETSSVTPVEPLKKVQSNLKFDDLGFLIPPTNTRTSANGGRKKISEIMGQLRGVSEEVMEENFIKGLKPDLRSSVRVMQPVSLGQAIKLSIMIDEKKPLEEACQIGVLYEHQFQQAILIQTVTREDQLHIDVEALENVVEDEPHFLTEIVDNALRTLTMIIKHFVSENRKWIVDPNGERCGGKGGRGGSMAGSGGGWFAKCSIVSNEGCGGGGLATLITLQPIFEVLQIGIMGQGYREPVVMSDASSAVTYMFVYTDSKPWRYYGEESAETGPPRVIVYGYDGLLMQPVALLFLDYVSRPEHPPSPNYVPGPKHPPSHIKIPYVPELEYPEYLEPSDDEAPLEDQPLPANASPITASPDYVADSDLDEDPKEDHEDDQADYPADGGDGDDKPSNDDDDDDTDSDPDEDPEEKPFEDEEDDEEKEEHLDPADPFVVPIVDPVLPTGDTEALEADKPMHTPGSPHIIIPFSQTRLRRVQKTIRPEPSMPASMEACITRHAALLSLPLPVPSLPLPLPSPLTISMTDTGAPLGYRAAKIRMRALLPSTVENSKAGSSKVYYSE
nr:ankyrin repeat-containing protein [Tanacetum cinerariifolium]